MVVAPADISICLFSNEWNFAFSLVQEMRTSTSKSEDRLRKSKTVEYTWFVLVCNSPTYKLFMLSYFG